MRNRRYETVFILPPDSDEGRKRELLDRLEGVVEKGGGILVKREDWGVRRLAYPVKNHPKGHYHLFDFVGSSQVVAELERHMRMLESVLRFLTVNTEDRVDLTAVKKEQAEEKDKAAAREAAAREAAAREAAAARELPETTEEDSPEKASPETAEASEDSGPEEESDEESPEEERTDAS